MGRKYLEVLTAKMMLGIRKKVHQARQNQKAFWNWVQVQSRSLGFPYSARDMAKLLEQRCHSSALTQGAANMSQTITRPLSRAPDRGWQVAMC